MYGVPVPSILLIDDDNRLASMVADYLRDHQFEVLHAATGAAALAAIKRHSFDVAKPFEPRELLARIRVVLRRGAMTPSDSLRFGRLEIDRSSRIVRLGDEEKPLTSYQFDLLNAMAERAGRVLSRETLAELVRGGEEYDPAFDRSIDVHVARLRAVLEDDPKRPRRILTVRGAGYVFAKVQS